MARSRRVAVVENEFERVVKDRLLRTLFQPIVSVESRAVAGYEGLIRGPAGSILESPEALIEEAYRQNRVAEFDWVARASASRAALASRLALGDLLFLNIEPLAMASQCPPDLWPDIAEAFGRFRIILEVTERSLDHDPRTLFEGIDRQRLGVAGLALDDVGANVKAMAMLPVIRPDVIKLDLKVTQNTPSREAMKVVHFAYEEAERTGATMLAEGVETTRHHEVVRALGAPLAQGWLYGKPTDDPAPVEAHDVHLSLMADLGLADVRSPYEALGRQQISRAPRDLVRSLAGEVFRHGLHLVAPALLVMLVPGPEMLAKSHLRVLGQTARRQVITGLIGAGIPPVPAPGVRGSWEHDPALDGEYAVIAVSPSTAVAVLARQADPTRSEFYFGVIHDRQRIMCAARCLLRRLGPQPGSG
ncbi:EAL domain-containing protein [Hamadaea tsunoensis]|uniref:EAL domain-containing protein n=1 Tax=Hamadaea tsunoensis TaxID=53368 RepID=UPI000A013F58|nr:EAL domain-containing protein [Hamadaea tsunoensis]